MNALGEFHRHCFATRDHTCELHRLNVTLGGIRRSPGLYTVRKFSNVFEAKFRLKNVHASLFRILK